MSSKYEKVAASLRRDVLSGKLMPGSRIETERDLACRTGVSRVTVRQAVRLLEEEGLLRRVQGSGTFVTARPARRIPLRIDYTATMRAHAPGLKRKVLLWKWMVPSTEIQAELNIDEREEVLYAERVDELSRRCIAWDQAYIAKAFATSIDSGILGRVDFVESWTRREAFNISRCEQRIEAGSACAHASKHIGLKKGAPVLVSREKYLTTGNRPAGIFISRYDPENICIAAQYEWEGGGRREAG